ncbi:hypothetical protein GCM10023144_33940 [Pigmentiphaga soli]|uniref:LysR substrate-binding domain-containing protein n=2 Tax=Pigmentiphaga soli TaxID=1007095 RepID=A0ABP8HDQ4_9BURK
MRKVADMETDEPRGALRITCPQSLGQEVLMPAVTEYLRRYPHTTIDLKLSSDKLNLVEERIDLAVRIAYQLDPGLIARPLGTCRSVLCASPSYLGTNGHPCTPEELARHNCLTHVHQGKAVWTFEQRGEALNVHVSGNLSANESAPLQSAAVQGIGIAILPLFSAAPVIEAGRLIPLLPHYKPQDMGIYAVYTSREHLSATLRTMVDFLTEWFEPPCRLAPRERRNRPGRRHGAPER